jgi:hypothetical protein
MPRDQKLPYHYVMFSGFGSGSHAFLSSLTGRKIIEPRLTFTPGFDLSHISLRRDPKN